MKIETEEVHHHLIRAVIDWKELCDIAVNAVLARAGFSERQIQHVRKRIEADVRVEDETAGSPPYRVGHRLVIKITEDKGDVVAAAEDVP